MENIKLADSKINNHSFTAVKKFGAKNDIKTGRKKGIASLNSNVLYSKNTE